MSNITRCSREGKIWHPIVKACMTREEYMEYERFYGSNSKAAQEMRNKGSLEQTRAINEGNMAMTKAQGQNDIALAKMKIDGAIDQTRAIGQGRVERERARGKALKRIQS